MTRENYRKMTEGLRLRPRLLKILNIANKVFTYLIFALYPFILFYLYFNERGKLFRAVYVPAVSFVFLSVFRRIANFPRPYEVYGLPSAIVKKTKGKSFPSRHVFSAAVIGMTALYVFNTPLIGGAVLAIALAMAVFRVVSGMHFPHDVVAGFLYALISGIIGFFIF